MFPARGSVVALALVSIVALADVTAPHPVAASEPDSGLSATLDGKLISLEEVGDYYCDDFSYPMIRCSSSRLVVEVRATLVALLSAVEYVTIYDNPGYNGAFMNVSQDYSALSLIGWNDRVSSFKGRNSETGRLYVDWFYSGSSWSFCCNTVVPNLGTYSNTFSSIIRT